MKRANFIGAPQFFDLNMACRLVTEAYGFHLYLVGSALERRDHRDVDLRLILPDEEFRAMFPGMANGGWTDARWSLFCSAVSLWLSRQSGLKVDFQVQSQTEASGETGPRHPIGILLDPVQPGSPPSP
ncbi:MAG: hypothetical protein HOW73_43500 [Polyangiaceae bacterium]|nr:hypothetical protein [Polyangiaceae bacterium]